MKWSCILVVQRQQLLQHKMIDLYRNVLHRVAAARLGPVCGADIEAALGEEVVALRAALVQFELLERDMRRWLDLRVAGGLNSKARSSSSPPSFEVVWDARI